MIIPLTKTKKMKTLYKILASLLLVIAIVSPARSAETGKKGKIRNLTVISRIESNFDAELNFEKWMTEVKSFTSNTEYFYEDTLEIESWMTHDFINLQAMDIASEPALELESWMTGTFSICAAEEIQEEELEFESWMINTF